MSPRLVCLWCRTTSLDLGGPLFNQPIPRWLTVQKRLTILAAGSTSSSGTGACTTPSVLKRSRPRSVHCWASLQGAPRGGARATSTSG